MKRILFLLMFFCLSIVPLTLCINFNIKNDESNDIRLRQNKIADGNSVEINAITSAVNPNLIWSVSWIDEIDLDINNYISLTPSDDTLSCIVKRKQNFSHQILLTCSFKNNTNIFVSCLIDSFGNFCHDMYDQVIICDYIDLDSGLNTKLSDILHTSLMFEPFYMENYTSGINYDKIEFKNFVYRDFTICSCCDYNYHNNFSFGSYEDFDYTLEELILDGDLTIHEFTEHLDGFWELYFCGKVDLYYDNEYVKSVVFEFFPQISLESLLDVAVIEDSCSLCTLRSGDIYEYVVDFFSEDIISFGNSKILDFFGNVIFDFNDWYGFSFEEFEKENNISISFDDIEFHAWTIGSYYIGLDEIGLDFEDITFNDVADYLGVNIDNFYNSVKNISISNQRLRFNCTLFYNDVFIYDGTSQELGFEY